MWHPNNPPNTGSIYATNSVQKKRHTSIGMSVEKKLKGGAHLFWQQTTKKRRPWESKSHTKIMRPQKNNAMAPETMYVSATGQPHWPHTHFHHWSKICTKMRYNLQITKNVTQTQSHAHTNEFWWKFIMLDTCQICHKHQPTCVMWPGVLLYNEKWTKIK